jgi:hypothetical protein
MKIANIILITLILLFSFFLRFRGIGQLEYLGDEIDDIKTSFAYAKDLNPFLQENSFTSQEMNQARLPFFLTSLFIKALPLKYLDWSSAFILRIPFIILGVGIILLTYFMGRSLYDEKCGILAALLLSLSSYHIGFTRIAVTSGDTMVGFFFLLSLLLFFTGIKKRNARFLLVSGFTTGLACASKFNAGVILLIFPVYLFILDKTKNKILNSENNSNIDTIPSKYFTLTVINVASVIALLVFSFLSSHKHLSHLKAHNIFLAYLVFSFAYIFSYILTLSKHRFIFAKKEFPSLFINILLTAIIITFIFSPTHIKAYNIYSMWNDLIFRSWTSDFLRQGYVINIVLIIFIRLGIALSLLFMIGFIKSMYQYRDYSNLFVNVATMLFLIMLFSVRNTVSWYLIPVFPLFMIVCSKQIIDMIKYYNLSRKRLLVSGILSMFIAINLLHLEKISPCYQLDGYQYSRSLAGVNKPSFVFSEGIGETIKWLDNNLNNYTRVGFISDDQSFSLNKNHHFNRDILIYVPIYNTNKMVRYDNVYSQDKISSYDYIISSSVYGFNWVKACSELKLLKVISLAGLDLYEIYKVVGNGIEPSHL